MRPERIHIGSRELISFPEEGINGVPAKVDTGADYSSLWASNIEERDGILYFTLFAPGSRYYTGKVITTNHYKLTSVRNSFGVMQERYKVKLLVKIRSKKVRIELTLADRGNNRYPMLIGKKTLRRRFVVDVAKDGVLKKRKNLRVLVMNSQDSKSIRQFIESLTRSDSKLVCDFATYDDIRFDIFDSRIDCTILNHQARLADYDLVYFKTYFKKAEIAAAMTEVAATQGVNFIDQEVASYHARTKLTQYLRLARFDIAVPDSIVLPSQHLDGTFTELSATFGLPFVMKDVASEQGESNYLITSKKEFDEVCRLAKEQKALYVSQRYVENDGDFRVIVLYKTVEFVIKRTKTDETSHLNNTSKGAQAERITEEDLGSEAAAIAVRAAMIMNRQVAGVDLVFDQKAKKWLVFEVNNSPQMAGGAYLEEKRALLSRFLLDFAKK